MAEMLVSPTQAEETTYHQGSLRLSRRPLQNFRLHRVPRQLTAQCSRNISKTTGSL